MEVVVVGCMVWQERNQWMNLVMMMIMDLKTPGTICLIDLFLWFKPLVVSHKKKHYSLPLISTLGFFCFFFFFFAMFVCSLVSLISCNHSIRLFFLVNPKGSKKLLQLYSYFFTSSILDLALAQLFFFFSLHKPKSFVSFLLCCSA